MSHRPLKALGLLLLVACLAAVGTVAWSRSTAERTARTVMLVVDGLEVHRLSEAAREETDAFLERLAQVGVGAVGVHEYTLRQAVADGRLFVLPAHTLGLVDSPLVAMLPDDVLESTTIVGWRHASWQDDPSLAGRLRRQLTAVGRSLFPVPNDDVAADMRLRTPAQYSQQRDQQVDQKLAGNGVGAAGDGYELWALSTARLPDDLSLGFRRDELATVSGVGLGIVPRVMSSEQSWPVSVGERVAPLEGYRVPAILFWGSRVSGYPEGVGEAAESLSRLAAPVGIIEFAQQDGLKSLARALDHRVVRVHSITGPEMAVPISQEVALERWLRAVRERGVRLLYVRFFMGELAEEGGVQGAAGSIEPGQAMELLEQNVQYLEELATRLRAEGYELGEPDPVPFRRPSGWAMAVAVLTVGAAGGVVVYGVGRRLKDVSSGVDQARRLHTPLLPGRWWGPDVRPGGVIAAATGTVGLFIFYGVLWAKGYTIAARQMAALGAAFAFPVLAFCSGWGVVQRAGADRSSKVRWTLAAYATAAGWSLLGAGCVVVLLDDVRFLSTLEGFRGVKVAHVVPLMLVAILVWPYQAHLPSDGETGGRARRPWHLWLRVALGAVVVAAGFVYVLRTGNQGLPLWRVEEVVRRFLEETLIARPRTKEFLIGHPALLLAYAAVAWRLHRWPWAAAAACVAGTVGQISIINTFAHVHSPIGISLLRTGYGWMLGLLLGTAAALALWGLVVLRQRGVPTRHRDLANGTGGRSGGKSGGRSMGGPPV